MATRAQGGTVKYLGLASSDVMWSLFRTFGTPSKLGPTSFCKQSSVSYMQLYNQDQV
jgi:hypothetical protein